MKFDAETYLLQAGAKSLGFDPGPLDGKRGKATETAIAAFVASPLNPNRPTAPSGREVNLNGLTLIKHFEGLYLTAYKDPVGIYTIGYGHTGLQHQDGTVFKGRKVTEAEAEELLKYDLANFAKRVSEGATVPLNDNQFAALVSFDFNTGGFLKSTLRQKLNAGDFQGAANEFLKWDKAGGKTLAGLTRRRKSERNLFLGNQPFIIPA
jgi:GH24 family phage-related lysozyme (muramidase)